MFEIIRKDIPSDLKLNTDTNVPYLYYEALRNLDFIRHGFSTRLGGVSKDHLSTMNLSFSRGDAEENVRENYRRLGDAIGFDPKNLVFSDQTHTTNVRIVTEADRGKGFVMPRNYTDVDGLITNVPNLVLATFFADCVPLFFADPVKKVIGLSHSGWRGTVHRMGQVTIEKMQSVYGCDPSDIICAIGPSICQDCYEVSEEVIEIIRQNFPEDQWDSIFYGKPNGHYQLDLWEANRRILLDSGILPKHLSMPNICTCCNPELLFSHRASKGMRGNLGAFLTIIE